ncbi:MAG: hypothetical protein E5V65_08470 [Mesorhizobium sp.]|nr:MAG: hypothetical protein E5V65_08470 [Mesorhizobium sp.]
MIPNPRFDIASTKAGDMHPEAVLALAYEALVVLGRMDESIAGIEEALGEWIEANLADSVRTG